MSHPLSIGYIVPQFPGQTHIFFWRELQALEAMGHRVSIFSTRPPPPGLIAHAWSDDAIARTVYLGQIRTLAAFRALAGLLSKGLLGDMLREGHGFSKDVLITLSAAWILKRHCDQNRLTHVHVHSCGRAALVAALCKMLGGPDYSITLHGPLSDYGPGQRIKWNHARFATIITQKLVDEAQTTLAGHLPDRIVIRPMGVDTDVLKRTSPYRPVERGEPMRLFSCGRLNVVKGHQDVMRAVRQLLDAGVDVRLDIAGEDDEGGKGYRLELETLLKDLHLQDHVRLLGAIDAGTVQEHLLTAHAFVLASWHEPLGVAYMEAMSCGIPTIGTDAGGVRELISDGVTGLLVAPNNPGFLADTIRRLANDPELAMRLGKAGRAHVVANFRSQLGAEPLVKEITRLARPQSTG